MCLLPFRNKVYKVYLIIILKHMNHIIDMHPLLILSFCTLWLKVLKRTYYAHFQVHICMLCLWLVYMRVNVEGIFLTLQHFFSPYVWNQSPVCSDWLGGRLCCDWQLLTDVPPLRRVCGRETPSGGNTGIWAFADHLHARKPNTLQSILGPLYLGWRFQTVRKKVRSWKLLI